jgi:hypothetical protein
LPSPDRNHQRGTPYGLSKAGLPETCRQTTIKTNTFSDGHGRTLFSGVVRLGRMHDQTAVRSEGIAEQFRHYPKVKAEVSRSYIRFRWSCTAISHTFAFKWSCHAACDSAIWWRCRITVSQCGLEKRRQWDRV